MDTVRCLLREFLSKSLLLFVRMFSVKSKEYNNILSCTFADSAAVNDSKD